MKLPLPVKHSRDYFEYEMIRNENATSNRSDLTLAKISSSNPKDYLLNLFQQLQTFFTEKTSESDLKERIQNLGNLEENYDDYLLTTITLANMAKKILGVKESLFDDDDNKITELDSLREIQQNSHLFYNEVSTGIFNMHFKNEDYDKAFEIAKNMCLGETKDELLLKLAMHHYQNNNLECIPEIVKFISYTKTQTDILRKLVSSCINS